jgi:hypothetical protein
MDAAQFKADFPAFESASDARIGFWLALGERLLPADRWADLLDTGLELYIAHQLTLESKTGTGGNVVGQVTSKSVDKISVSYDTAAVSLADAGHYNASSYGVQLLQLARMIGAGGFQL